MEINESQNEKKDDFERNKKIEKNNVNEKTR